MPTTAALVTGAARGIGFAIASRLSRDGFEVVLLDRDAEALERASAQLGAEGASATAVSCDLAASSAPEVLRDLARGRDFEVLVNNAAVYPRKAFERFTLDEVRQVQEVNLVAAIAAAQALVPGMIDRQLGSIVNVSSVTVRGGVAQLAPYVASKAALIGLTTALATELGPAGIRVNALTVGSIPTAAEPAGTDDRAVLGRQALKRRGTVEDVASAAAFLAGRDASFVTGQALAVDGGFSMGTGES